MTRDPFLAMKWEEMEKEEPFIGQERRSQKAPSFV